MPGWHKKVADLVQQGKLVLLGVTQEQHAERCQLYAKWQGFEWPILHDPINSLECRAVPITCAIDEQGVVQNNRPNEKWVREWVAQPLKRVEAESSSQVADVSALRVSAKQDKSAASYRALADHLMLWETESAGEAIQAYRSALELDEDPVTRFRLGVALRHRYDSKPEGDWKDFTQAVNNWVLALRGDPNQYIWRRRIQQYGPRLDKPYPFYDWVDEAISDLASRGEKVELKVPLSGAEIARPLRKASTEPSVSGEHPDPDGMITRDAGQLIQIQATAVPSSDKRRAGMRMHLSLKPTKMAAWNNEVEPVRVWFEQSDGYSTSQSLREVKSLAKSAESHETRTIEAEFGLAGKKNVKIRGFVLYHVCEKSTQQCIFRRQDFSLPIKIE